MTDSLLCTHINEFMQPCPCLDTCMCRQYACKEQAKYLTDSSSQPPPRASALPYVKDLVMKDIFERGEFGRAKYNTYLQPFNGRDVLKDTYQELLDATFYIRQLIYERDNR